MWENKPSDPKKKSWQEKLYAMTMVDLGNGLHMNMFKHFMEFPHWIAHFPQQVLNSMGVIPREILSQLTNKRFLTPGYSPTIVTEGDSDMTAARKRLMHSLGGVMPITTQQMMDTGPQSALGGFMGFPIYGMTPEQKQAAKEERRQEKQRHLDEAQ